jgi:ribokinase
LLQSASFRSPSIAHNYSHWGDVLKFDCAGYGSINIDEFWETSSEFFELVDIAPGEEVVRDVQWFNEYYPSLKMLGVLKAIGPGGSAANTIAALRRMGFSTGFFGAAGNDIEGKIDLDELGQSDLLRIRHTNLPSGRCIALINTDDAHRDRALVILPNANNLADKASLDVSYFCDAKWVHLTSFVSNGPLEAQRKLVQTIPDKVNISFDPGAVYCRLGMKVLESIIARSRILFLAEEELGALMGPTPMDKSISRLISIGAQTIVIKMGHKGIKAFQPNKTWFHDAVKPIRIVDRTGAGDVAAAGFIAGMILSLPIVDCLALASGAASKSIQGYGRSAYPDREYLNNFLVNRQTNAYF